MRVRATGKTHVGLKRRNNEDRLLLAPDLGVFVIGDGMGGHRAGEVASRMLVETMTAYWQRVGDHQPPPVNENESPNLTDGARHLVHSISLSNRLIYEAQKRPEYYRMGTTVAALLVEGDRIWCANVGDSPIYLSDQGRLIRISEEHSVAAEQKNLGVADPFSETSPLLKNILTRVLGLEPEVEVYIHAIRPEAGDIVLMCSDGLTNYTTEGAIRSVLAEGALTLEQKTDRLIDLANQGGGGDNISAILVEILEERAWERFKKKLAARG